MARTAIKPTKLDDTRLRSWLNDAPGKRIEVADALLPGFYAIRQPSGKISFAVRYLFDRKPYKLTLGQFPKLSLADARVLAKAAFVEVAENINPAAEKRIAAANRSVGWNLVENVITRWADAAPFGTADAEPLAAKTIYNYLGAINVFFCKQEWPAGSKREKGAGPYRGRTIQSITLGNLMACRAQAFQRSPSYPRLLVKALRAVFGYAVTEGLLEKQTNPAHWVPLGKSDARRSRVLKPSELTLVLEAAKALEANWRAQVELLLLTGKRRSEVQFTPEAEWNFKAGVWVIPGERTKTGAIDHIPILPRMRKILQSVPRLISRREDEPMLGGWGHVAAKRRLDAEIVRLLAQRHGVPVTETTTLATFGFAPWVWHDLRRSANSQWRSIGIDFEVREDLLNHFRGALAETYDPDKHLPQQRAALEKWAAHLELIRAGLVPDEDAVYEDIDWESDPDEDAVEISEAA